MNRKPKTLEAKAEAYARRARWAKNILNLMVIILIGLVYISQQQEIVKFNNDEKARKQEIVSIEKDNADRLKDLQNHVDCLFTLATTPHTTTNPPSVDNIVHCKLSKLQTSNSSAPAIPLATPTPRAPLATVQPSSQVLQPQSTPAPSSTTTTTAVPPPNNTPVPPPHPLVCTLTLHLLGCKP
jgi:hypothetical protein